MKNIEIYHATQGNLKNLSVEIPRNQLVVLTGLSGSGKTTLAKDVLYMECQRQYLEAMAFQGIQKPRVERVRYTSPAILITQNSDNRNPRSSVGTVTDIYTDLRMIFEKLCMRSCPACGEPIAAWQCREEVEKTKDDFTVFMYCSHCGHKMKKLTRTFFSFNTREGACPDCEGLGEKLSIREEAVLHTERSLEEGAVDYWQHKYQEYQTEVFYTQCKAYGIPAPEGVPVKRFSELQRMLLLYGTESAAFTAWAGEQGLEKKKIRGKFEGVYTTLLRRMQEKQGDAKNLEAYFSYELCNACGGERLAPESRRVTVAGKRLPELSAYSLEQLLDWLRKVRESLCQEQRALTENYLLDMETKLGRLCRAGLGYLTLDRQTRTLSGGESQRMRLAAAMDSELTGMLYILDEPTIGLHPKDTAGMIQILKGLRDLGNTVVVIEHDEEVMRAADWILDLGPGAGKLGGSIVGQGTFLDLQKQETSVTGRYFAEHALTGQTCHPEKLPAWRKQREDSWLTISHAKKYNLKDLQVKLPTGCLTSVAGVSGSGKSTLIFEVLAKGEQVSGLEQFDQVILAEQAPLSRMKRSNIATFSGAYGEIRKLFGQQEAAKAAGFTEKHFSFNTPGGRCEHCQGLGYVVSNLLFFQDIEVVCPVCGGARFEKEILQVTYEGKNINDILALSVDEAAELFAGHKKLTRILSLLQEAGLGYLELGQTLTTLSGGEGQRLKLAKELLGTEKKKNLYLMDEPTTGLHPLDVEHFLKLLKRLVREGSTVITVEHNPQILRASDWILELGPEGGDKGGELLAEGTPEELRQNPRSVTGAYL